MEQRLMAVWRYDAPPYFCAAEIEEIRNDGSCLVKGYHSYYSPVKILPYDQDRINELNQLAEKHREAAIALNQQCMADAKRLMFIE